MSRIGNKMYSVLVYVSHNAGCSKLAAGRYAWGKRPGKMTYIYGPVERAIKAGLIKAECKSNGVYSLTLTDAGHAVIDG